MSVISVRHDWPEKAGMILSRPEGLSYYTFLHFKTPVTLFSGGKRVSVKPGGCIFYPPDAPQWFKSDCNLIHNWIHFSADIGTEIANLGLPQNEVFYPRADEFITHIFRKIEAEYFTSAKNSDRLLDCYLSEFLIKLSRITEKDGGSLRLGQYDLLRMSEVRKTVLSDPLKRWTIEDMASLASLSSSRFHALYKAAYATSPMHDLIDARIHYAMSVLISEDSLPIPKIAEMLGYNDQYHFIRQFKASTGETPASFRKRRKPR